MKLDKNQITHEVNKKLTNAMENVNYLRTRVDTLVC